MTVYIERGLISSSRESRELSNGLVVREELLSIPKIVIRRTNTNGIVLDEDKVRYLTEKNLEDIENARHLVHDDSPEEPLNRSLIFNRNSRTMSTDCGERTAFIQNNADKQDEEPLNELSNLIIDRTRGTIRKDESFIGRDL